MGVHSFDSGHTGKASSGCRPRRQRVAVRPCASYHPDAVYEAMCGALDGISFKAPRGKTVLLKPNVMGQNSPGQATTTHPSVVDAACRIFSGRGCAVSIGDSSAFYQGGGTRKGFVSSGIASVAEKYGARLISFESTKLREITSGRCLERFHVTGAFFEHDLVVNLPKLKLHRLAKYTGAIKNMYGCVPGGAKQLHHMAFQHRDDYTDAWGGALVDVYQAVTPHLTVMDAVFGLDKDGPAASGEPHYTGLLLASTSGPALDFTACRIIGFDPGRVPALCEAISRGMTSGDAIEVNGNMPSVPYAFLPDAKQKKGVMRTVDDYVFRQLIVRPEIAAKKCTRCDACVEGCAPGAIRSGAEGPPVIDYQKCIYCYCCVEYCTNGAVSLRGSAVNLLIRAMRRIMKL